MQLTTESIRQRWLIMVVVWSCALGFLIFHARAVDAYLNILGQLGLRGASEASTPLKAAYPAFAADAQTWVRHSLALLEGDAMRLRFTTIDNAPDGREVHWNSAWAWTIGLAGSIQQWLTGMPLPQAVERATIWLNPLALLLLTVLLSSLVARRAGALPGVFVTLAMIGHPRVADGFFPGNVDHHGLVLVAVLGLVLGAALMGAGWWSPRGERGSRLFPASVGDARRAATFSALSGAFGMWVSAASTIVPIGIVGVSALAALLVQSPCGRIREATFDGEAWRRWGRVGGLATLFFYLLEYFPSHLGFRLESNHAFYALAWWGWGQLIAEFGERWLGVAEARWLLPNRLLLPLAAIAVAPITIVLGGTSVFVVMDPFLSALHNNFIQEFRPLGSILQGLDWNAVFSVVGLENLPLLVGIGILIRNGRRAPFVLWFTTIAAAIFTAVAWIQARWLLNASGSQVTLGLVLIAYYMENRKPALRWGVGLSMVGVVFLPSAFTRTWNTLEDVRMRRVTPKDAGSVLARDIAAVLRRSQPEGEITVLSSPNMSTSIGYYGRFKSVGTLYWENCDGLKAAAALHAAQSPAEAAELVRKRGITHFAMVSDESFVERYFRLLHPRATDKELKQSFGYQLADERVMPTWLQVIPYSVPDDLRSLGTTVLLFKVNFDQSPADALYSVALGKIALGLLADAERDFDTLIRESPQSYQPWLRKGDLLFARQEWAASAEAMFEGISRAPAAQRPVLFALAAKSFYERDQPLQAIQLYRAALRDQFDPNVAAYLAFILSTTSDNRLRDGIEAQSVAEQALKMDPTSPTLLNSLAAALAENGRFAEAIATAERAVANARLNNETSLIRATEERLAVYRSGKPLRK